MTQKSAHLIKTVEICADSPGRVVQLAQAQQVLADAGLVLNIEREAALPQSRIWIASVHGGDVSAVLVIWEAADELQIIDIATRPAQRRHGLAKALLQTLLDHARHREPQTARILLEVRRGNSPAIHLYEKAGFSTTRIRPRYYSKPDEDAVEMVLELATE